MKTSFLMGMLMLIFLSLGVGFTSSSWFGLWVAMELNTLAFLGYLSIVEETNFEGSMKYFLIQSGSSFIFLFSSILASKSLVGSLFMLVSLLVKLGSAPFHSWVPMVSGLITWSGNMLFLTLQKLIPLFTLLMASGEESKVVLVVSAVLSSLYGGLGGWNELNLRKLLGYSSISHTGWMISCTLLVGEIWFVYFLFYSVLSIGLMMSLSSSKMYWIKDLSVKGSSSHRMFSGLAFLSLSGIPPFSGFIPKWSALEAATSGGLSFLFYIILILSIMLMAFYLRVILSVYSTLHLGGDPEEGSSGEGIENFWSLLGLFFFIGLSVSSLHF